MPSLAQEELEGPRGPQGARQAQQDRRRGFALPLPSGWSKRRPAVRSAGPGAYGKWLDYTTNPSYIIPC